MSNYMDVALHHVMQCDESRSFENYPVSKMAKKRKNTKTSKNWWETISKSNY